MKMTQTIGASIASLFIVATATAEEVHGEEREVIKVEFEEGGWWDDIRPVVSIRGGLDYAKIGGKTSKVLTDMGVTEPDMYVPTDKWHSAGVWGALLGIEIPIFSEGNRWQTGVSYYQSGDFRVHGDIFLMSNELLDNLLYEYKVRNQRVLWENKWLTAMNPWFDLYFLGGIGWSANKASGYKETNPTDPTDTRIPFSDHTANSFTYSVGFGMEVALLDDLRAGLGYQYSDLGKVELGKREGPTNTDESISVNHSPTQELIANLTYIF